MPVAYDREAELRARLNSFLEQELSLLGGDYYARLDLDGFLRLKSVLSDINNILTLKISLAFANWVSEHLGLSKEATETIISQILGTKPNANGYDIEVSDPVKFIAEVKCNIPINSGRVYGSAQKNGIAKDIDALISGKSKSSIRPAGYLKFMVFLDKPEIRAATAHYIKNMKDSNELITYVGNESKIQDTEKVCIIYVGF